MKRFMKICLILAVVFAVLGIGFLTGGIATGATLGGFYHAVSEGDHGFWGIFDRLERWADDLDDRIELEDDHFEKVMDDFEYNVEDWADDFENDMEDWADGVENHVADTVGSAGNGDTFGNFTYDADQIRELKVDLKYGNISILPGSADEIVIEGENTGDYLTCRQDGNTLKISGTSRQLKNADIWIYVPAENSLREAEIEMSAAALTLEDFTTDKLDVSVGAGQLHTDGILTAKEITMKVGTGEMNAKELISDEIELECGLGSMEIGINGKQTDYDYEVSCGMGNIQIGENTYSSLSNEQKIRNDGSRGTLEVSCGMGSVSVDFTEA